ncbi:protein SEH1-like isoform X1 [Primulina huaijiensis]|uniref:protein SEH1-like isoform X1 n=1 Tax=Primulina huaijiensis TaxID=1492673 RepID=UPI003CC72D14
MDKHVLTLDKGTTCTAWNHSGQRLAAALNDGTLSIYDSTDPASSVFSCTSRFKVQEGSILKVVWAPPEFGDVLACISANGILSLWEEVAEGAEGNRWKLCKSFERNTGQVLDAQFGDCHTSLKLVAAFADGKVKIYELLDILDLEKWQLQAQFQNVVDVVSEFGNASCLSASISWNPQKGEVQQSSFIVGFSSNMPSLNFPKVWEYDQDHQRWLPVAELSMPEDKSDQVYAVAWAPNIGRPYELIAVANQKGIGVWHLGLNPDADGRLPVNQVVMLHGHDGEVWQMEWDMSGMTLATTGTDGVVRLWQANLNGVWHEQAVLAPAS